MEEQKMKVFQANTYREICDFINANNIPIGDCFQIVPELAGGYTLIYFK